MNIFYILYSFINFPIHIYLNMYLQKYLLTNITPKGRKNLNSFIYFIKLKINMLLAIQFINIHFT